MESSSIFSAISTALSIVAITVSIRALNLSSRQTKIVEARFLKEDEAEFDRVLLDTNETVKKISILDEHIWKIRMFTRRQAILDAMDEVKRFWNRNSTSLYHYLGNESRPLAGLAGYYQVVLENETNNPLSGIGEWRGLLPDRLLGYQLEQALNLVAEELGKAKKRRMIEQKTGH